MKEFNVTLTEEEIEILKDAINYQDVYEYHKKIDKARKNHDEVTEKFYSELWFKSVDLFTKLHKIKKGEE